MCLAYGESGTWLDKVLVKILKALLPCIDYYEQALQNTVTIHDDMFNLLYSDGMHTDILQDSWTVFTIGSVKVRVQRPCVR